MECSGLWFAFGTGKAKGASAPLKTLGQLLVAGCLAMGWVGLSAGSVAGGDAIKGQKTEGVSGINTLEGSGSVDLALQFMESRDPVVGGTPLGDLVHTLQVENLGPDAATGIEITVDVPQLMGVTVDGVTPGTGSFDGASGVWTLASLASGGQAELQFFMTISAEAEVGSDAVVTSAQVTALADVDSEPDNDEASVGTSILDHLPVDTYLVIDGPEEVEPGSSITLTIEMNNYSGSLVAPLVTIERPNNVTLNAIVADSMFSCDDDASSLVVHCVGSVFERDDLGSVFLEIAVPEEPTTLEFTSRAEWFSYDDDIGTVEPMYSEVSRLIRVAEKAWKSIAGPSEARSSHTATLLVSNEIMVVGGLASGSVTSSVEIFNPQDGSWRGAASLVEARSEHAALLLSSGGVLVAGGRKNQTVLQTVEQYLPDSGIWASMPPLQVRRKNHTLTLLGDGSVLAVGGVNSMGERLASAETLAPGEASWVLTSPLHIPRFEHTATLLRSGEVLVIGGSPDGNTGSSTAEIYDPENHSWSRLPSMNSSRRRHTATLLSDGRVLVDGGVTNEVWESEIFDAATRTWQVVATDEGYSNYSNSTSLLPDGSVLAVTPVELYDPSEDSWIRIEDIEAYRSGHTATLLQGGQVVVVGGRRAGPFGGLHGSAEIFGKIVATRHDALTIDLGVYHGSSLLADGRVLVTGGVMANGQVSVYNPQGNGSWNIEGAMAHRRVGHRQSLLSDGRVLVTGGIGSGSDAFPQTDCFDIWPAEIREVDGSWSEIEMIHGCRFHHTMTQLLDGRLWITGGENYGEMWGQVRMQTSEFFDPSCNCFRPGASLPGPRAHHTATLLPSGQVLIAGGEDIGPLQDAYKYDPRNDSWETASSMNFPRSRHAAVLLPSGRVLVAGGEGFGAEIYDPETDSWSPTNDQPRSNSVHPTLTLLPSGYVLLVGVENGSGQGGAEFYDPVRDLWTSVPGAFGRYGHSSVLLRDGRILVLGGALGSLVFLDPVDPQALILDPVPKAIPRPNVTEWPAVLSYTEDVSMQITGTGFRGVSEGSSGTTQNSSTAFPLIHLQALNGGPSGWLQAAEPHPITPGEDFWDGSMTLDIAHIPPIFNPGWHRLTVFANGIPSRSEIVQLECSLSISEPRTAAIFDVEGNEIEVLEDPRVPVGGRVRFEVASHGGRSFQWQRNIGTSEQALWTDLDGANESSYLTPQLSGVESGSQFRVQVSSGCMEETSEVVAFTIDDSLPPVVSVLSPSGGEHWALSTPSAPNVEQVVFEVSDETTWTCQLQAELIYSNDQGETWHVAPPNVGMPQNANGELPRELGQEQCSFGEEIGSGTINYALPMAENPPSGQSGSLYKIRLRATDQAGNVAMTESPHPFFILPPNDQSVRTLILFHPERLGVNCGETPQPEICRKVRELAQHPQVGGRVINLQQNPRLAQLYRAWDVASQRVLDMDPNSAEFESYREDANLAANDILFGTGGIHSLVSGLANIFSQVESVLLIGDDKVIPMARVLDRSGLLGESAYTDGTDLAPSTSAVGLAIDQNFYLTDDPLMTLTEPIGQSDLDREGIVFLPDVAVGRLVETPGEIVAAIQTFQQFEGVLDLTIREHKVLVTGYDFLTDSARVIEEKWRCVLDPHEDTADGMGCEPEPTTSTAALFGQGFDQDDLSRALCGDPVPYGLISLNGHATHYKEGVPGQGGHHDIQGLSTEVLDGNSVCDGQPLDLGGAVIYAVGCHGGLPVSDAQADENFLDLSQVFLKRGALAYLANTGYGWGLNEGIGYSERLMEIFSDQLQAGDSVSVGRAMLDAKRRYLQETRRPDAYAIKTLMQWTTFGFPMAKVVTGLGAGDDLEMLGPVEGPAPSREELVPVEQLGPVTVYRTLEGGAGNGSAVGESEGLPPRLDRVNVSFEFSEESYIKRTAEGDRVGAEVTGCPSPKGCYYTLNSQGRRGTGDTDRPIQPFLFYDSRLSGTSQHGVLWLGGTYREEDTWLPIFAELISNGVETGSNHGVAPQVLLGEPIETNIHSVSSNESCRATDLDINTMVIPAGEVRMSGEASDTGPVIPSDYDIQRRYESIDVELFYFNNPDNPSENCDRTGPIGLIPGGGPFDGKYHEANGSTLSWNVPVSDPESGVWRVVVVYDVRNGSEAQDGVWHPLELTNDPDNGTWTGERSFSSEQAVTYVIQAVDRRGNVSWLRHGQTAVGENGSGATPEEGGPNSGVDPLHPRAVAVSIDGSADLALSMEAAPSQVTTQENLRFLLDVELQDAGPATSVRLEIDRIPGSEVVAAGNVEWECDVSGDPLICQGPNFVQGELEQAALQIFLMAPPDPGTWTVEARVSSAELDPNSADNRSEISVVVEEAGVSLLPQVAALTSAAQVAGGTLEDGASVNVALTQLRVAFTEWVDEADDSDNFLLVEAGPDGVWQTESRDSGPAGDDISIPLASGISFEDETFTTVLNMPSERPLPNGRYLLFVGGGIYDSDSNFLDGDGDGAEGGDFQRTWTVNRQHLTLNPNFDGSLAEWFEEEGSENHISHSLIDAEGVPSSGSLVIEHLGGASAVYSVGQCLPIEPGERLAFGGRLFLDPEDAWQTVQLDAEVRSAANCGGNLLGAASNFVPLEGVGGDEPHWQVLPLGFVDVPDDGQSVMISLTAVAEDNAGPAVVRLDNVEVFSILFADGFESGTTAGWSRAVGN